MKLCAYCGKELPKNKRKYCDKTCSTRFKTEGPAREQYVYQDVPITSPKEIVELQNRVDEGTWLLFPVTYDDEQCTGDFMRVFKRAPKHVIYDPRTPWWKFAGPVWTEEENERRWQGYAK